MNTIAFILAGGEGQRLYPLTARKMKALVSFCNRCVLIDFAISNIVNSGITSCYVLVQDAQYDEMREYLRAFSVNAPPALEKLCCICPAQLGSEEPFVGTADALLRTLRHVRATSKETFDLAYVCGADHVYLFDVRRAIRFHSNQRADVTIVGGQVSVEEAFRYGVLSVELDGRITSLVEKPRRAVCDLRNPNHAAVSMGDYIFDVERLLDFYYSANRNDVAGDIIPDLLSVNRNCRFFNFEELNRVSGLAGNIVKYWRDIGTIESYWETSMCALSDYFPILEKISDHWPLYTGILRSLENVNDSRWPGSAVSSLAKVDAAAALSRCIVMPGATICGAVDISDSIIAGSSVVTSESVPCGLDSSATSGIKRVKVYA